MWRRNSNKPRGSQKTMLNLKKSTYMMLAFWGVVVFSTAMSQQLSANGHELAALICMLLLIYVAVYFWFIQDAKEIGLKPSKALRIGVLVGASLCIPYYLIRYKGWRRASLSFLKFCLLFLLSSVAYAAMPIPH